MPSLRTSLFAATLVVLAAHQSLLADTFFLSNGGRIEGELLNRAETPRKRFVVSTTGGKITLAASQVEHVTQKSEQEQRYEQVAAKMSDSAKDHWHLSQWCLENQLITKRKTHLQRVIELDPNHQLARRALGFRKNDGRWLKPQELMKERGFVHHKGLWRTTQEVELLQEQQRIELAKKDYRRKVRTWSRWLGGRRHQQALENLRGITDPLAASSLASLLRGAKDPETKELAIDVLGRIGGDSAVSALVQGALEDPSESIRDGCLRQLQHTGTHSALITFVKTLQHKSNAAVNRAAMGLERLQDESVILPLIRALRTTHKFVVRRPGGGITPVFGSGGNGGLSAGDNGPKIVKNTYDNESVLAALVSLTGENFRFDVQRWIDWYNLQETPSQVTLRRDP